MLELNIDFDPTKLSKKLKKLERLGRLTPFLMEVSSELHLRLAEYPPSTSANKAKRGHTHYQRGLGSVYTTIGGKASKRFNSEQLGRKWDILKSGKSALLRNKASYSAFVHSKQRQAIVHKRRGWKTELDVWAEMVADGTLFEILDDYLA